MEKRHLVIAPTNSTADDTYSYSNGQQYIRFDISNSGILIAKDLRFEFEVEFFKSNNAVPTMAEDYNIDPTIAYQSLIQTLNITSRSYQTSMERINQYPRLAKHIIGQLHSKSDCDNGLFVEQHSRGYGNTEDNDKVLPHGLGLNPQILAARKMVAKKNKVSFRLLCGLCLSEPLDLDAANGLTFELTLNNNSAVLFGADAVDGYYQISKPRIHAPVLMRSDADLAAARSQPTRTLNFLSFTSIFDVLNTAGTTSINHRLGLRNTLGVMVSFCPTSDLNNFTKQSLAFYNPGLEKITFYKNSQQYPLYYTIEVDRDDNQVQINQGSTLPQVIWNYQSSHRSTRDIPSTLVQPNNIRFSVERNGLSIVGAGVSYDEISNVGVNASVDNLSVDIQATLKTPSGLTAMGRNEDDTTSSFSAFFFYLNANQVVIQQGQSAEVMM